MWKSWLNLVKMPVLVRNARGLAPEVVILRCGRAVEYGGITAKRERHQEAEIYRTAINFIKSTKLLLSIITFQANSFQNENKIFTFA